MLESGGTDGQKVTDTPAFGGGLMNQESSVFAVVEETQNAVPLTNEANLLPK